MSSLASDFTQEEIQHMLDNIDDFSVDEVVEIERLVDELDIRRVNKLAYDDLIEFCKAIYFVSTILISFIVFSISLSSSLVKRSNLLACIVI